MNFSEQFISEQKKDDMRESFERIAIPDKGFAPFERNKHRPDEYAGLYLQGQWVGFKAATAHERKRSEKLVEALRKSVNDYGKPGGPWNVPSEPGTWLETARKALREYGETTNGQ